jgi:hypothetical protein
VVLVEIMAINGSGKQVRDLAIEAVLGVGVEEVVLRRREVKFDHVVWYNQAASMHASSCRGACIGCDYRRHYHAPRHDSSLQPQAQANTPLSTREMTD